MQTKWKVLRILSSGGKVKKNEVKIIKLQWNPVNKQHFESKSIPLKLQPC